MGNNTEKAVFVLDWNKEPSIEGYDRMYFGSEICQYLLPKEKDLEKALAFCARNSIPLTLVTPPANDHGIEMIEKLVSMLDRGTEVVINDWGALRIAHENKTQPVMGRLLVKWVKNAGYDDTCRDDEALWAYAHSTNFTPPLAMRFLSGIGISRIELDNLPHGYDFQTSGKVRFSVYYPYVIMHYTKKCSIIFGGKKYPDPGAECPRPCSANVLKADLYGNTAYLGGSVIYFVNDVLPKILDHFVQMDRVVFLDKWPV